MSKHLTTLEISVDDATLGQALVFDGTRFVPGESGGAKDIVVPTIADRDALDTTDFKVGQGVIVGDASGDPTVSSGNAYYKWDGTTYIKISEAEANDAVVDEAYAYDIWSADPSHAPSRESVAGKFQELEDLLGLLAPAKAPTLSGTGLSISIPQYAARLSAGLPASWYESGVNPGDLVTTVYQPSYNVALNSSFRAGLKDKPATFGTLNFIRRNASGDNTDSYDLRQGGGTTPNGVLNVNSFATYNNYWNSARAQAHVTRAQAGYETYQFTHTEAGSTQTLHLTYDDRSTPITISGASASPSYYGGLQLSGITFLTLGDQISVFGSAYNVYNNTYAPNEVARMGNAAGNNVVMPDGIPQPSSVLDLFATGFGLTIPNVISDNADVTLTIVRPETTKSIVLPIAFPINTYGIVSTPTTEYFLDEAQRLYVADNTSFMSQEQLRDEEAQVRNGKLGYAFDYTKSGLIAEYKRMFNHASAATTSGILTLAGVSSIQPYADMLTGAAKGVGVALRLVTQNVFFDLGLPFGQNRGTGSGNSLQNARGARVSNNGNTFNFSFGTYTSADNGGVFELRIILSNDKSVVVNSIVLT